MRLRVCVFAFEHVSQNATCRGSLVPPDRVRQLPLFHAVLSYARTAPSASILASVTVESVGSVVATLASPLRCVGVEVR